MSELSDYALDAARECEGREFFAVAGAESDETEQKISGEGEQPTQESDAAVIARARMWLVHESEGTDAYVAALVARLCDLAEAGVKDLDWLTVVKNGIEAKRQAAAERQRAEAAERSAHNAQALAEQRERDSRDCRDKLRQAKAARAAAEAQLGEALVALRDAKPFVNAGINDLAMGDSEAMAKKGIKIRDKINALLATDAAQPALERRQRREQELLILLLVEAGELTEGQGAQRLGVDRLDLRALRLQALGKLPAAKG